MRIPSLRFIAILLTFALFPSVPLRAQTVNPSELDPSDRDLLLKIQQDSLQYFIRSSNKDTGLTRDSSLPGSPASIAATGFSLAAFAIGASHGWIDDAYARQYLSKTLKSLLQQAEHENGFFYHFLDAKSGRRVWRSEASSIDTALLVAGALLAAQYYPGTPIAQWSQQIYDRVDWNWMMNNRELMCMGWTPENGFLSYYWDSYNELIILQALAIGASKNAIPKEAWTAWLRREEIYEGKRIIYSYSGSLFTYQYAHAFIDFRPLIDGDINYFENSVRATEANRSYSLRSMLQRKGYSPNSWGLSASLGPGGYRAYGGKPGEGVEDGTIAPYAAISSIVFTPDLSLKAVRHFYEKYRDRLYGHFGFRDAFNLDKNWWAQEYIGIDQGITVLMLENYLADGSVWKKFMANDAIRKWIELSGIKTAS